MKALTLSAAALLWLLARPVLAQDAPAAPQRGDVAVTAGWLTVDGHDVTSYNRWHGQGLFGAGFGWYWTAHQKSELTASASTETTTYDSVPVDVNGQRLFAPFRYTFSTRRFTLMHQYQFGDNAWFHPFVGAGVEVLREHAARRDEPLYFYDQITRQSRLVRDATPERRAVETDARAIVAAGIKSYVSRRAFISTDFRLGFNRGVEDVLLRFGVGADF
jgi:opacity protein-like surface antigen